MTAQRKETDSRKIEKMVEENTGLVSFVLNKYRKAGILAHHRNIPYEDFHQIGMIGLFKAAKKYDRGRTKFSTFATACIKNEINNEMRKNNFTDRIDGKSFRECKDEKCGLLDDPEMLSLLAVSENGGEDSYESVETKFDFDKCFENIEKKHPGQKDAVRDSKKYFSLYLEGYSWREVAELSNVTYDKLLKNIRFFRRVAGKERNPFGDLR